MLLVCDFVFIRDIISVDDEELRTYRDALGDPNVIWGIFDNDSSVFPT